VGIRGLIQMSVIRVYAYARVYTVLLTVYSSFSEVLFSGTVPVRLPVKPL
jgi:hypothetical protein